MSDLMAQTAQEFDLKKRTNQKCPFCKDFMIEVPNCYDEDKQTAILLYCPRSNVFIR